MNLANIIEKSYNINVLNIESINNGHINTTYKIITNDMNYVFQKINREVFNNPSALMDNIEGITNYLKTKNVNTLNLVHTNDNKNLTEVDNNYYRLYEYIEDGITYKQIEDLDIIYNIGKSFGNFEKNLIDYPKKLNTTIKDFHNTKKIYDDFINNIKDKNIMEIDKEIEFVNKNKDIIYKIHNLNLPLRIIHGDTKISNVIINNNYTVIDLDTVMYSTILYDYGDMIRSISNKTYLDLDKFKSISKGYLNEIKAFLTKEEIDNLGIFILIIIYELGIRYLDDYINGNIYFKVNYETENLDKSRYLFKLYDDVKSKLNIIDEYIKGVVYGGFSSQSFKKNK